jgi:hypothetical protein
MVLRRRCSVAICLSALFQVCILQDLLGDGAVKVLIKVKQSRNRPGVAQRVPGGLASQIFMTFGT